VIQQIGELTRMLHDAIDQLGTIQIGVMPELQAATHALPDARSRLNYIANKTSDAANRVLNSVDEAKAEHQRLHAEARQLGSILTDAAADQADATTTALQQHVHNLLTSSDRIDEHLTNIMLAQDFHDLTGQIINKVVRLTDELETSLVRLLLEIQPDQAVDPAASATAAPAASSELQGPVVDAQGRTDVVSSQNEVDDLLARMGF
jgi:chemotaxis protein CheZ